MSLSSCLGSFEEGIAGIRDYVKALVLLGGIGTFPFPLPYFEMFLALEGRVRLAAKTLRGWIILGVKVASISLGG